MEYSNFYCSRCPAEFRVDDIWYVDIAECPECKTRFEIEFDEYCYTDEDGFEDETYYWYLGEVVK